MDGICTQMIFKKERVVQLCVFGALVYYPYDISQSYFVLFMICIILEKNCSLYSRILRAVNSPR